MYLGYISAPSPTLGHLLALHVTPANEQDRAQVAELMHQVQQMTGESVEVAIAVSAISARLRAAHRNPNWLSPDCVCNSEYHPLSHRAMVYLGYIMLKESLGQIVLNLH